MSWRTISTGAASADWDLDGDLDIAVNNTDDAPTLLENRASDDRERAAPGWLGVTLVGRAPNTQAIGAVVTLGTEEVQRRWVILGDQNSVATL